MTDLVIVESPAKAKSIGRILGSGYRVKPSMGHVRDLPEKNLGVEIKSGFRPRYVVIPSRRKIISELRKAAQNAGKIYLAPDPDREGEAIAWHLMEELGKDVPPDRFLRVSYNEITEPAIRRAFEKPGQIDMRRVESQQARRVLDRLVGYLVSPLLWRRVKGAASAGRVQSVALRLVCEREQEIRNFVSRKYWVVFAELIRPDDEAPSFEAQLVRIGARKADIDTEEKAQAIVEECGRRDYRVASVTRREVVRKPLPPLITSTLQQAASRYFGFTPARTMRIAQRLYEGLDVGEGPVGLITYMRTDSVRVAEEAQKACRELIKQRFGEEFLPARPNVYRSRPGAQEAHEAIRPTDVSRHPDDLKGRLKDEEWKLYNLIWRRFVASQMAPARLEQVKVIIRAERLAGAAAAKDIVQEDLAAPFEFHVTSSQVLFAGFTTVLQEREIRGTQGNEVEKETERVEEEGGEEENGLVAGKVVLPRLEKGDLLRFLKARSEEKETKPPPRYTEATLVKALEQNGVGRPSTYAQIISTLYQRKYVVKEKRALKPTRLGEHVNEFLVRHLPDLFEVGFTARMEEELDRIERGETERVQMLSAFYDQLQAFLEKARGPRADSAVVGRLLELLEPLERDKDSREARFIASVRRQFEQRPDRISEAQLRALAAIAARRADEMPELREFLHEHGLEDALQQEEKAREAAAENETARVKEKLEALANVEFDPPRKVGRRTYDDRRFVESLRRQLERGRSLSSSQIAYLDRLLLKYAGQLGGEEQLRERFGLEEESGAGTPHLGGEEVRALVDALSRVEQWEPPRRARGRQWDDRKFYESVRKQFEAHGRLSPRQVSWLRRLAKKYGVVPAEVEAADG